MNKLYRTAVGLTPLVLWVAAACTDAPTAPGTPLSRVSRMASSQDGPKVHSNMIKYSDAGAKPTRGRSGSASIESRALIGKDRTTMLEVTTGSLDEGSTPPGTLAKVQVKLFTAANDLANVQNYNHLSGGGYASFQYTGLSRNASIRVQSNIRGIDGDRTDVVTLTSAVKLRPDPSVTAITVPEKAKPNEPVHIAATVSELNGDVGARANCVLSVDGQEVDQAAGIWIDAGSTVSCAFVQQFATPGIKQLQVAVTNVVPGDWDDANNSRSASIEIVNPEVPLTYSAQIYGEDYTYSNTWDVVDTYSWGQVYEYHGHEDGGRHLRTGYVYGHADEELQFPLTQIDLSHSIDGSVVNSTTGTDLAATFTWDDGTNRTACYEHGERSIYFSVCGYRYAWGTGTNMSYQVYAGVVAYAGSSWNAWHYQDASQVNGPYYWDLVYTYGDPPYTLYTNAVTASFNIRVEGGGTVFTASPTLQITTQPYTNNYSYCYDSDWYWYYYHTHDCRTYVASGWFASASGSGQ